MQQIVYAMGDIHADFNALNIFINKKIRNNKAMQMLAKDDELEIIVLQCGDFCFFWPPFDHSKAIKNKVSFLKDGHVKIYWCAGNHENHDMLDVLTQRHAPETFIEVAAHVHYATFGSVLKLLDGTKVLFCGGGESEKQDKERRLQHERQTGHRAWWKQEGIDAADMQLLPEEPIDWVVSHARPLGVPLQSRTHHGKEASQSFLEEIRIKYSPTKWLHGHYHVYEETLYDGCEFICLNHSSSLGLWYKLVAHMGKF